VLLECQRLGRDDRANHDDQGGGQAGHHVAGRDQQQQGHSADDERGRVHVADLASHLGELRHRVARVDVDPGELAELTDDEHDGDAMDVAHQHGPREVVGQPPQPE
jgi:hypothetical protein